MNTKIIEAIEILKCFEYDSKRYWIINYKGLSDSEKGFVFNYFEL